MLKFVVTLLFSLTLNAADPWTKTQIGLEAGYQVALLCDWRQTSNMHRTWHGYDAGESQEGNPLLGKHPSQASINQTVVACAVGHLLVSHFLPSPWRYTWQGVSLAVEISVVSWNQRDVNISIKF